jgi:hypothetical protein
MKTCSLTLELNWIICLPGNLKFSKNAAGDKAGLCKIPVLFNQMINLLLIRLLYFCI